MDERMFTIINRFSGRHSILDIVMIFLSKRIRYVYLLVLIILWVKGKSTTKVAKNAIISASLSWIIRVITNIFLFRPRPFVSHRVGILIPSKTDSTYFSKHTILAFAVSTSILLKTRLLGLIMLGLSVLTGFSRVWVGHHYPSDIVRSAIVGGMVSFFVEKVDELKRSKNSDPD